MFWDLIDELREKNSRVKDGTIMGGRCALVGGEFLALVDYKNSGLVVKLPRKPQRRRSNLVVVSSAVGSTRRNGERGTGSFFAPPTSSSGVFRDWLGVYLDTTAPHRIDWNEIAALLEDSFRLIAPRALIEELDNRW